MKQRAAQPDQVPLGELVEFRNGISFDSSQKGRGIAMVGVGDFVRPVLTSSASLDRVEVGELSESAFLRVNDLLFVRSNGSKDLVGRAIRVLAVDEPTTHAGFTIRARPHDPQQWSEFLWHYFQSGIPLLLMRRYNGGTNITNLSQDLLADLPVPDLGKAGRPAFCRLLSTWDRRDDALARLIDAKRRMRDGLAAELLVGRRRLPAFARRPWREFTIGELLREENRFVRWNDDAEYDLVSVRRWAGGVYTRDRLRGSEIKVKVLKRIRAGDILISHIQSAYGAMALVGDDHDGHYVSDLYMVMVPRERDVCDSRFFGWHCRRPWMWHQAKVSSNGFMAERLRIVFEPAEFLRQPIRVPVDIAEQSAIADVLDAATREIDALDRLRDAVNRQKRGLMQGLLTGKIRIMEGSHG